MESKLNLKIERPNDRLIIIAKEGDSVTNTIVFLHGLGDSGEQMLNLLQTGFIPFKDNFRYIFPTSPFRFVTKINKEAHAWYDVNNLLFNEAARYKEAEILESVEYVNSVITFAATDFHKGDYSQVFLGGHS